MSTFEERLRANNFKPTISDEFNTAVQIERQLQQDGHRLWGFAIYRCTYDSDPDWTQFMQRLRLRMTEMLEFYYREDIMDNFDFTVIENRDLFDGASTSTIREHFKSWAAEAPQR